MSDAAFRTFHALRIKGFASTATIAEVASLTRDEVEAHLQQLLARELAMFQEARGLWRLTPAGRDAHAAALAADIAEVGAMSALAGPYHTFLALNDRFKSLCGEWQLRDGEHNDHSDADYDLSVIGQLVVLNDDAQPLVREIGRIYPRLAPYADRLDDSCQKVVSGETKMFTGVMCGSYHDVWMELHEDLILTQGIDRAAEGSF
jgi:hypothetical protein